MLRLFKGTGPGVILLIIFTAGLLWAGSFGSQNDYISRDSFFFGELFYRFSLLISPFPVLEQVFAFLLMFAVVILIISFNTGSFFLNERTFLPGALYIIITALFTEYQTLHPVMPASLLLLFAVIRIADSHRKSGIAYNYFDAGLMIGAGSLLYPNLIWFGFLLFAGILLLRSFNVHEVAISLLGLITPYLLFFGFYYVAGSDLSEPAKGIGAKLFTEIPGPEWPRALIIAAIFVAISLLVAIYYLTTVFSKKKVKSRKIFSLFVWVGIISLLTYFFSPSVSAEMIYILAIPVSYILANYYIGAKRKRIFPEILFTGTLVLILMVHLLEILGVAI